MKPEEFEEIVAQALDGLPEEFAKALENVAVTVEEWPTPQDLRSVGISHGTLFGLYRGVPKPARAGIPPVVPDKIVIFSGPILAFSSDPNAAREQIRPVDRRRALRRHERRRDKEIRKLGSITDKKWHGDG